MHKPSPPVGASIADGGELGVSKPLSVAEVQEVGHTAAAAGVGELEPPVSKAEPEWLVWVALATISIAAVVPSCVGNP